MNTSGQLHVIGTGVAVSRTPCSAQYDMLQVPFYGVGWYRDPLRCDGFRFFDGGKWTPTVINRDVNSETGCMNGFGLPVFLPAEE
jgi:hypothetical protein